MTAGKDRHIFKANAMEWYNKQMAVTFRELTDLHPVEGEDKKQRVMSVSNYKKLSSIGTINVLRAGKGLNNPALVAYESLPQRFKLTFVEIHGNPYEVVKESMMKSEIVTDTAARDFYAEHLLPDGTYIPEEYQEEYVNNASVLNTLISMLNKRRGMRKAMQGSMSDVWDSIHGTVERLRKDPGHTLPGSRARLRDKINEYQKLGYACLISGKLGNTNTLKITPEAGVWLVVQKRKRVPVLTNRQIWEEYNRVAPAYGWDELKAMSSVTTFLNRPENRQRWYDAVYGELKAHQKFGYKFKTALPEFRDALWYGDGTKLNLYYKHWDGKKWVMKTTMVYEVMDAYSEVLLGYHISDTENYGAQYNAYRMAVERAQAKPYEIVTDNQGGHKKLKTEGFMSRICRVARTTTPYRASAKSIEQIFGRFQAQELHKDWRFTGQNITAQREDSRPNLEFVMANVESLYTLEELEEAYAKVREVWNNGVHPSTGVPRLEMYNENVNHETEKISQLDMIEMFWMITARPATFTASGLEIQLNKQKYSYDVYDGDLPDFEFRRNNIGRKFFTQYDPLDLTRVRLFEETSSGKKRYVTDAHPYMEVKRAAQEATHESSSFIHRVINLEEQIRIDNWLSNIDLEHEHGVAPEQFGLNRPVPKGIAKKAKERALNGELERVVKVERKRVPVDVGSYEKELSNVTYDELDRLDKL